MPFDVNSEAPCRAVMGCSPPPPPPLSTVCVCVCVGPEIQGVLSALRRRRVGGRGETNGEIINFIELFWQIFTRYPLGGGQCGPLSVINLYLSLPPRS